MVRWTVSDGVTTYTFPVNPNEGGSPKYAKRMDTTPTSAGTVILRFEGRPEVPTGSFSGALLTQDQLVALTTWAQKGTAVTVTDDLGRSSSAVITSFSPDRAPHYNSPWRHTYSIEYVLLGAVV